MKIYVFLFSILFGFESMAAYIYTGELAQITEAGVPNFDFRSSSINTKSNWSKETTVLPNGYRMITYKNKIQGTNKYNTLRTVMSGNQIISVEEDIGRTVSGGHSTVVYSEHGIFKCNEEPRAKAQCEYLPLGFCQSIRNNFEDLKAVKPADRQAKQYQVFKQVNDASKRFPYTPADSLVNSLRQQYGVTAGLFTFRPLAESLATENLAQGLSIERLAKIDNQCENAIAINRAGPSPQPAPAPANVEVGR
ncbi:MAG: hypothetical protein V4736_13225 [Bdellovibrionota bacterium]